MEYYPAHEIETKWQKIWQEKGLYRTGNKHNKKYYVLEMFPYPSGDLHMGHLKNYVIGDVVTRIKMMEGYDVLHPMGWDAFGLPAENAAIKNHINPLHWTRKNIDTYRDTFKMLGISYDWEREIGTCFPDYYKWTQYLFVLLYEKGLAYKKKELVNWCPHCKTVLANEQVVDGKCERCHTPVVKKELKQWFLKITDYADRLLNDLAKLEGRWPSYVIKQQENWIGRSYGTEIVFEYENNRMIKFPVFTTRADTLFGVTFVTIAPEHELLTDIMPELPNRESVEKYVQASMQKTEMERTAEEKEKNGVFTGVYVIHPLTGARVPLWVGDYVLAEYGTGIVMGVPAHDQRDFVFAKKHNLPVRIVIKPGDSNVDENMDRAFEDYGIMVNSGEFTGLESQEGIEAVQRKLESIGKGKKAVSYRIRDWLISRQRYWGAPIPVVYCEKCGIVPVSIDKLPVKLPQDVKDFVPKGRSPLEDIPEFMNTTCPKCGARAKRDPDTMDTFVDSSWYFLRFIDPHNEDSIFDSDKVNYWMPVDQYIGGKEHATKHLIYARFIQKFLYDNGLVATDEPFDHLFTQGLVHKSFFWCPHCLKVVDREEVDEQGRHRVCGTAVQEKTEMMSKSRGNVVPVGPFVREYGADIARITILFAGPAEKDIIWQDSGVEGAKRFLTRVYNLFSEVKEALGNVPQPNKKEFSDSDRELYIKLQKTIKRVRDDCSSFTFNTAIAALMELLNELTAFKNRNSTVFIYTLYQYIKLLAPFAPHLSEELNSWCGENNSVFEKNLPEYDKDYLYFENIIIPVQVNGKVRGRIEIERGADEETALSLAKIDGNVKRYIDGKKIKKVIFLKDRLLNIVVA